MVILFRGIAGSGKSSLAEAYRNGNFPMKSSPAIDFMQRLLQTTRNHEKLTFSADDFFMTDTGEYRFVPKDLSVAHQTCLRKYVEEVKKSNRTGASALLVDNTNCSIAECSPYMALAGAYGHEL